MPTQARHQDFKYPIFLGLRAVAEHPGGGAWGVWRDSADRDEDLHNGVLSEPARLQHELLGGAADQRRGSSGRCCTGDNGEALRVRDLVHALPQAKHGKL